MTLLVQDPYFMRNHLGTYECKLCLTLHNTEGSYLVHTQGKKHQSNLAQRAAKEAKDSQILPALEKPRVDVKRFVKIGRPGYKGEQTCFLRVKSRSLFLL
jgi:splicing factor 3A subunit 2